MSTCPNTTTNWYDKSIPSIYEAWDRTASIKIKVGYMPLIRDLTETHGVDINVLDYGCGPGTISSRLIQDKIRHVDAVDANEEAINIAIKHSDQKSINYHVIKSAQIPFPNEYFDAAIACFVFVTIPSRDEFINIIRDIYRTLKAGGTFYILDLNADTSGLSYPSYEYGDSGDVYHDGKSMPAALKFPNGDVRKIFDTYWSRSAYEGNLRSTGFSNVQTFECDGSHLSEEERKSVLGENQTQSPYLLFKATKPLESQ